MRDENLYLFNRQTNLVIALHATVSFVLAFH